MTDAPQPPQPTPPRPVKPPAPRRTAKSLLVRLYSLALLVVTGWLTVLAFQFLFRSVFWPRRTPERFVSRRMNLTLADVHEAALGTSALPDRPPMDHYHGVGLLRVPPQTVGCATSGCHDPLPHVKDKATRAFANFHVNFLECTMCHAEVVRACWVDPATGGRRDTPAMLSVIALLDPSKSAALARDNDPLLRQRLQEAIDAMGGDPALEQLLVDLNTSQPDSPVYRRAIDWLRTRLPDRARGDYGVVIGPDPQGNTGIASREELSRLARSYFAAEAASGARKQVLGEIHTNINPKPNACAACHGTTPPPYEALGFSPQRAEALRNVAIARVITQIREGHPFHLPGVTGSESDK